MREPMVVTHEGGTKFATEIRGHTLIVDQPVGVGNDEGPMPLELLGASVGTCVALYVQQFCHSRGLPYEGMRVEVQQLGAQGPSRIGKFDVRVLLAEPLPEQYAADAGACGPELPGPQHAGARVRGAVRIEQPERVDACEAVRPAASSPSIRPGCKLGGQQRSR
jgi:putative redox protein